MNEYKKQAEEFLKNSGASMQIDFIGISINTAWKETTPRNSYNITIKTARGSMTFIFWDSIRNTEISNTSFEKFVEKTRRMYSANLSILENEKARKDWKKARAEAVPTCYDVLACLTKYDPGTFEEFCGEYGYNEDSRSAERVYIAVIKEFKQLERIFTPEQLDELREIQ